MRMILAGPCRDNHHHIVKVYRGEGKTATNWPRFSCFRFLASEAACSSIIVYNLGNLLCRLALLFAIQTWSLKSLQQRLFKTGGHLIGYERYFLKGMSDGYCI